MRIAVLNGPNLNLLGLREPERYGRTTLAEVERSLGSVATELGVELECAQHNGEGQLIDAVHGMRGRVDGVVINAGAYTHTSLALHDAIKGAGVTLIELHISNVHAREAFRHHSYLSPAARAVMAGFGVQGYPLAIAALAGF